MKVFVGTSGWLYDWNEDGTLDWYVENSGLNAVELNACFYRFPFQNQVKSWKRKSKSLRWAIKVHRSITHLRKFGERAYGIWDKFKNLFNPLEDLIDFYLFQLPPNYSCREESLKNIERFYLYTDLGKRFAIEFRHPSCFKDDIVKWAEEFGITLVSIDSPIARWIVSSNKIVYLRLHGSHVWYGHDYSREELEEIRAELERLEPEAIYVFFNNNHWMLENARLMKIMLENLGPLDTDFK
ncbi:MAG: DUF72 domain-containing protein [Thermosphaera sp.]